MPVSFRKPPLLLAALACASAAFFPGCAGKNLSPLDELGAGGPQYETIAVFATANLQSALLPIQTNPQANMETGGSARIAGFFGAVRAEMGDKALWLDGGHLYGGMPLESGFDQGRSFEAFVQQSGMSATLILPNEDEAPPLALAPRTPVPPPGPLKLRSDSPASRFFMAGSLKIAAISGRSKGPLLQQAALARQQGAQFVVWLSDLPITCEPDHLARPVGVKKPGEVGAFCEGPLRDVVAALPSGTLDAVVSSGNPQCVDQFVYPRYSSDPNDGVPVVSSAPGGRCAHLIYLTYDRKTRAPARDKTRLEGPFRVGIGEGGSNPKLHGRNVGNDSTSERIADPARTWLKQLRSTVVAVTSVELAARPLGESALGDLVADAIREGTHADFALIPPGLIKHAAGPAAIPPGPVSEADLLRAMPVNAMIRVIPVTGEELKTLVRISENGTRGFSPVSGMKLRLIRPERDAPVASLAAPQEKKHAAHWELNRLIELSDPDGDPLHSRRTYLLAVPDFLISGGDDWAWASRHFSLSGRVTGTPLSSRALVSDYLKGLGQKGGKIGPLLARMSFEEPRKGHGRRSNGKSRRLHASKHAKSTVTARTR